jgi:hypothetical protein
MSAWPYQSPPNRSSASQRCIGPTLASHIRRKSSSPNRRQDLSRYSYQESIPPPTWLVLSCQAPVRTSMVLPTSPIADRRAKSCSAARLAVL